MPEKSSPEKSGPETKATPEGDRIAKVLSRAGIASRREAERMIEAGEVKVNGKTVTSPAMNVTAKDRITVSGQPVAAPEPARLWLYNKPEGLVTSASDEKGRDTVFDHLPEDMPRVMSIGRLDLNSEGLLLLTNDGELKRQLELPSTGWLRKYRVRVKGNPTDPELEPLRRGIVADGERFMPMDVKLDRHQGANAWLTVGLREGKNREIRRAMGEIGLTVNRLIRVSYGPFRLNDLKPGEVEEVRPRILREQLGALLPDAPDGAERRDAPRSPPKPGAKGGAKPVVRTTSKSSDGAPAKSTTVKTTTARAGLSKLSKSWEAVTDPRQIDSPARPKPFAKSPKAVTRTDDDAAPKRGPKPSAKLAPKPKSPRATRTRG